MGEATAERMAADMNELVLDKSDDAEFSASQITLLLAAERLFAERAIESVSLREIAQVAGNGNNNAVQYHFGSKEGLIDALFVYRVRQMDKPRRAMLNAMARDNELGNLRRLAEAYCMPILDLTDSEGRHTYAGFIQQYILRYRPQGLRHAIDTATETTAALRQLQGLVEKRLSHLPADLILLRLGLGYLIFANMLVWSDNDGVAQRDRSIFEQRIEDALSMMVAAYEAPELGAAEMVSQI